MRSLVVLAALVAVTCAVHIPELLVQQQWHSFKATHNKTYKDQVDEAYRMKIFKQNLITINEHNERYEKGLETYYMGVNHLADLLSHEITEMLNGLRVPQKKEVAAIERANVGWPWDWDDDDDDDDDHDGDDSTTVDWRPKGYVSDVKNQGQCGSCWSFSTTGALEGQLFKKTGKLISLSEQNLMDCSWKYGNMACNGGLMTSAFKYIQENKGIDTESSYPYTAQDSRTCKYTTTNNAGANTDYVEVNPTEKDLKEAVTTIGPIAVGINAGLNSFSFYSGGVYYDKNCDNTLDHGVLVVGYGTEKGQDYWLVKNSWGASWGESGYVKMARNKNNHCGIADMASYPVV